MELNNLMYYTKGKKYYLDIFKAARLCSNVDKTENREREITEAYQFNEDTRSLELTSKINRELKDAGRSQDDIMSFELLKMLIARLLDEYVDSNTPEDERQVPFAVPLIFDTLIHYGILVEIKE